MASMSTLSATQRRAIERAQAEGILVLARGTVKATGERFYLVSGSTGKQYCVKVAGPHLTCTCPAGQHDRVCKHRAAIFLRLVAERETTEAAQAASTTPATKSVMTTTMPAPTHDAPLPMSRPAFSLFKAARSE